MTQHSWKEWLAGGAGGVVIFLLLEGHAAPLLPLLFLGALAYILLRNPLGLGRSSDSEMETVSDTDALPMTTFDDIGGQTAAKQELKEALRFLMEADEARNLGIRPLRGILLSGPPGTGKTLLAKAAAHYTESAFVSTSGSAFIQMYAGVGAKRVRRLFEKGRQRAREMDAGSAILFIDEIEVLAGKRGRHQSHLEYDQTLNQLLVEMDGLTAEDEVRLLVVGATNRDDLLDEALLRPGRFDRTVRVDLPDREARQEILEIHTANKPLADGVDLGHVARQTFGFSGAHLESLANEAAILAMRGHSRTIRGEHLSEAVDKVMMGEKLDRQPGRDEMYRIAVHEGGHGLISELLESGSVASITITSRGEALGYVRHVPEEDQYLQTQPAMERQICRALAGSIAEQELLGSRSTGAANDIQQAMSLARQMVLSGMSPLGVVSQDMLPEQAMHEAVSDIVQDQEQRVTELIRAHRPVLEQLAGVLFEDEHVDGDRLRDLIPTDAIAPAS